jgi:hypothetical protein
MINNAITIDDEKKRDEEIQTPFLSVCSLALLFMIERHL